MVIAAGTHIEPELVLSWNRMSVPPATIDLVLHLHGYAQSGAALDIAAEKLPISGLDFTVERLGRPTLGMIPRGRFFGGRTGNGYDFPALARPGAVTALIEAARMRFAHLCAVPPPAVDRRILTAHSGGGAALMPVAAPFEPHEIHVFDALYGATPELGRWAERAIAEDAAGLAAAGAARLHALQVLYLAGTGTEASSLSVAAAIERGLADAGSFAPVLAPRYRVAAVATDHGLVARRYGVPLLRDVTTGLAAIG